LPSPAKLRPFESHPRPGHRQRRRCGSRPSRRRSPSGSRLRSTT